MDLTTTPAVVPDAATWTGDPVDHDSWFGALNPHGAWGLANRRRLRAGVWCHARFLSRSELQALGTPHGRTSLHGALFAPCALPGRSRIGPLLDTAGRGAPGWGAFQVLAIDNDLHP